MALANGLGDKPGRSARTPLCLNYVHRREATGCSLIGPTDPPPVEVLRPDSTRPVILLADHAGVAVPQSLNDLGLSETDRRRHFAWDIGIEPLTKRLSAQLGATAVLTHYSRLLIDPNRELDDPTSIPVIGEDCVIEGNRGLTAADRQNRANNFFHPYHDAVTEAIDAKCRGDDVPVILSLHSFTPMFKGQRRPWHIGVLLE